MTKDIKSMIEEARSENTNAIAMIKMVRNTSFTVGDFLIRKYIDSDGEEKTVWKVEKYDDTGISCRYKVVAIDHDNIPWIVALDKDGLPYEDGNAFIPFDFESVSDDTYSYGSNMSVYEVDPLYVDATLLDQEFDIQRVLKEQNSKYDDMATKNAEQALEPQSLEDLNSFFMSLSKGDRFYVQHNKSYLGDTDHYEFVSLRRLDISKLRLWTDAERSLNYIDRYKTDSKKYFNDSIICELKLRTTGSNGNSTFTMYTPYWCKSRFYLSKPFTGTDE